MTTELDEALALLQLWVLTDTADGTICMSLGLYNRIEEALAQPPDAKPVATLICPKCGVDRFKSPCGNASHIMTCPLQGVALAAPQPPAGKSNKITDEEIDQISWDELPDRIRQGPGELLNQLQDACRIIVRKAFDAIDAIPREIHERLIRDAKREALREAAAACVAVHDERKKRSGTDFGFNAIMECKEAIDRMASSHEQSAPGGK